MTNETVRLYSDSSACSGCGACSAVCSQNAIVMREDVSGCLYPVINDSQCIRCGKCVRQCAYRAPSQTVFTPAVYAAKAISPKLSSKSASGGLFAVFAHRMIQEGYVSGAVMDLEENPSVYHLVSDKPEDISRMQGSKYVQSRADVCYAEICSQLKQGKPVLFSGTPCQCAAVKQLTGDPDNLITVDLICHGVPPMKMLRDYLGILERTLFGRIKGFTFRDKSTGKAWRSAISVAYGNKQRQYIIASQYLSYYRYFLGGVTYRENCYSCPFACAKRVSDITIGDYWGIEKYHVDLVKEDPNDWSCLIVNSEKGMKLFEACQDDLHWAVSCMEWIRAENKQLNQPSAPNPQRSEIMQMYCSGGYARVETAFRKSMGGAMRFRYRMIKDILKNQKTVRAVESDTTETE